MLYQIEGVNQEKDVGSQKMGISTGERDGKNLKIMVKGKVPVIVVYQA